MKEAFKKIESFEGSNFPFRISCQQGRPNLVPLHWHEHIELIKVTQGCAQIVVGNKSWQVNKNELVFVNSAAVHSVTSLRSSDTTIQGIIFDRAFLSSVLEGFENSFIYSLFVESSHLKMLFTLQDKIWEKLNENFKICYDEYVNQDIGYQMCIKSGIYQIISLLLRENRSFITGSKSFTKFTADLFHIRPVIAYMEKYYMQEIYTAELAKLINLSECYFTRRFKSITGLTPSSYIKHIRINMAVKYLSETNLPISEISEKTGFLSVNYFDEVFKQEKGISPAHFRKLIKASTIG